MTDPDPTTTERSRHPPSRCPRGGRARLGPGGRVRRAARPGRTTRPRPPIEVERPADAVHGDFASNLAMKLARPYRMAPLAIASALAAEARPPRRPRSGRARPIAAAEVAPPGFLNLRLRRRAPSRRRSPAILADPPAGAGSRRSGRARSTSSSCRPTRPVRSTIGNARGAFVGDLLCRVLEAGGQRVTREYYFNDSGGQIRQPRRIGRGDPARRAGPRGRLPRRLRRRARRGRCPTTSGPRPTLAGRRHRRPSSGTGRPAASARASRRSLAGLGVRFDVWTSEARLHDEGWVERAVERLRERGHVYEQDGAIWFRSTAFGDDKDRVIFRSERRADLLRRRHRLRHREVQPRLRPPHLHLGRRPPRHGRPRPQRRRGDGLRPRGGPDAALLVGPVRPRRRRKSRCASAPASSSRSTSCWPRSASTPRAGSSRHAAATTGDRLRHRAGQEAVEREPGLLRPVRARPDRLDPAQGGRRRARAGDRRRRARWPARPRPPWPGRSRASRRSSRTPSRPRRPRASPPTRPSSRRRSTRFYRDARVVDADEPERSAARLALAEATQVTLANALGLLGISAPESM